jgi:hypothetical protein
MCRQRPTIAIGLTILLRKAMRLLISNVRRQSKVHSLFDTRALLPMRSHATRCGHPADPSADPGVHNRIVSKRIMCSTAAKRKESYIWIGVARAAVPSRTATSP